MSPNVATTSDAYELVPNPSSLTDVHSRNNNNNNNDTEESRFRRPRSERHSGHWRFFAENVSIVVALVSGISGALGCFGFTYWLSRQTFACPVWALDCELAANVSGITQRLGLVQGIISTFFGISISLVAYSSYQLAETTMWPILSRHSARLQDVDRLLLATRGSIQSSAKAMWYIREAYSLVVVLSVLIIAVLLQINATVVGYAFDQVPVPTPFRINTTIGGGMGFGFSQVQEGLPSTRPAVVGWANSVYAAWSNNWGQEPMPAQRNFLFDRSKMSMVGDFCAHAVEVEKQISCHGTQLNLSTSSGVSSLLAVSTSNEDVFVRREPKLTLWVDDWGESSNTTGWATIVFAALNGTIENGTRTNTVSLTGPSMPASGLKCNVSVTLSDSSFCTSSNRTVPYSTLSSLATLNSPGGSQQEAGFVDVSGIAVWIAAVATTFGENILGAQPMFEPGTIYTNQTLALPVSYTSTNTNGAYSWDQATLKNFIDVGTGALNMVMTRTWFLSNSSMESLKDTARLETRRSFFLLIPLFIALLGFLLLLGISVHMHRRTSMQQVRLASVSNILIAGQTEETKGVVDEVKLGGLSRKEFASMRMRYDRDAMKGLGGFVQR